MKYYYISHEGPFRNNLIIGKDADRILRDKNKVIITRIKSRFHVLVCRNGIYEKEKRILSYFELVEFLKKNNFNAYFVNVSGETASYISSYVRNEVEYQQDDSITDSSKPIFTLSGPNLLKIEAFADRNVLREKLGEIYQEEIRDERNIQTIGLFDLIDNNELFELINYPINEKNGRFTIPSYSYSRPSLYYMLSGLYNKEGKRINLTGEDLKTLALARVIDEDVVNAITGSMTVNVLEAYSHDQFNDSVDFVDLYKQRERDRQIELVSMKKCLAVATENAKYVGNLRILNGVFEVGNVYMKSDERSGV